MAFPAAFPAFCGAEMLLGFWVKSKAAGGRGSTSGIRGESVWGALLVVNHREKAAHL